MFIIIIIKYALYPISLGSWQLVNEKFTNNNNDNNNNNIIIIIIIILLLLLLLLLCTYMS